MRFDRNGQREIPSNGQREIPSNGQREIPVYISKNQEASRQSKGISR